MNNKLWCWLKFWKYLKERDWRGNITQLNSKRKYSLFYEIGLNYNKNHEIGLKYNKNHEIGLNYNKNHEIGLNYNNNHEIGLNYNKNHENMNLKQKNAFNSLLTV